MFSDPHAVSVLGAPIDYEIKEWVADGNVVSSSTLFHFNITTLDTVMPILLDIWIAYDANKQISQYDAVFRYLEYMMDTLMEIASKKYKSPSKVVTQTMLAQVLAKSVCDMEQQYCKGGNKQYRNHLDCMTQLTLQKRFGKPYEFGRDTLLCRVTHKQMLYLRPDEHCPHVGPKGGDMCIDDTDYFQRVMDKPFTNSGWIMS